MSHSIKGPGKSPGDTSGADQALVPLLAEDATVCIERSTRDGEPTLPPGLELLRTKTYGETAVHYAVPA